MSLSILVLNSDNSDNNDETETLCPRLYRYVFVLARTKLSRKTKAASMTMRPTEPQTASQENPFSVVKRVKRAKPKLIPNPRLYFVLNLVIGGDVCGS